METEAGACPECGDCNLSYGISVIDDENQCYPFTCDDCGSAGTEIYRIERVTFVKTVLN